MKKVNELAKTVQAEGTESLAFYELFTIITAETIEPKAESFSRQLKGDVADAISEGYQLLLELVEKWERTGSFHSFFKTSYTNRLINKVKATNADVRSHNTSYDISISESIVSEGGNDMTIIDRLFDKSLYTEFDIEDNENTFEGMLAGFRKKNPEQADIISIMLNFSDDDKQKDKTNTYCEYFGVHKYTSVIQKRVSRAREAFKNYLIKNNYDGVAV